MIKTDLQWICRAVDGQLFGENCTITEVSTDTRNLPEGCLFIALQGDNFDAHDFVADAVAKGAKALLVERKVELPAAQVPQIVVQNTRHALGLLGAAVKASVQPKTIAITGSSGKTTVKEMLAAILRTQGNVLATAGNFNNDIGVPLTLLRLTPEHDLAIIELGANHQGEIGYTTRLTQPDVAIINNVAPAHVEGFGSVHGVFRANTEIFKGLNADGLALTPIRSEFAPCWQKQITHCKHLTFGQDPAAPIYATDVEVDAQGCAVFTVHLNEALTGTAQSAEIKLNEEILINKNIKILENFQSTGFDNNYLSSADDILISNSNKLKNILFDPQTNGPLLISIHPKDRIEFEKKFQLEIGFSPIFLGKFKKPQHKLINIIE